MTRRLSLFALVAAIAVVALVFWVDPRLDLDAAEAFYRGGHAFAGQTPLGDLVRRIFYWIPAALAVASAALYAGRRWGKMRWWAPTGRGVVFVLLTFAVGPGLLTNVLLKNHSHRPRPYQTREFGGDEDFRPFYRFDGACARNCSFVSGEGATSAWTIAPALLVPPPARLPAVAAALVFTMASGGLRMAFGGHYFSDSLFAILFTWTVLWLAWVALRPRDGA